MGRRTRECYLCGETYSYCPTCFQDRTKPAWMAEFHSENCKDIFDICTRFNMKLFTKEEAKEAIEKCDLSNKLNFRPSVQNTLSNLFKVEEALPESPKKRGKRAEMNIIDEVMDVEQEVVENIVLESHEVVKKENE